MSRASSRRETMGAVLWLTLGILTCLMGARCSPVNLPACQDCSYRADVPCRITRSRCLHYEFVSREWPGQPRDLEVKQVTVNSSVKAANFSWSPPYDASILSLKGFYLEVNILNQKTDISVPRQPYCFFANISGTNWSAQEEPHAVTFHFDCIQTSSRADILLTLTSLPSPTERLDHVTKSITIEGTTKMPPPTLSIQYRVEGYLIHVSFHPLLPGVDSHKVCLIKDQVLSNCFMEHNLAKDVGNTTFDVKYPGNYSIMISRGLHENHFYKTSMFTVPGPLAVNPVDQESSHVYIIVLTLSCLVVITLATTIVFWSVRKQFCKKRNNYVPGVQNNTKDNQDDPMPTIFPLVYSESVAYKTAVRDFCSYLQAWGICHVKTEPLDCYNDNQISGLLEQSRACHVLIFVSPNMLETVTAVRKDPHCVPPPSSTPHVRFLYKVLQTLLPANEQKTYVSLCHMVLEDSFRQMCSDNMFHLSDDGKGDMLELNKQQVQLLINRINETDEELTIDRIRLLLTCIEPARSIFRPTSIVNRQYSTETDQGFGSGGFCSLNDGEMFAPPIGYPCQNQIYTTDVKSHKMESTYHWAQSQMVQAGPQYHHGHGMVPGYIHDMPVDDHHGYYMDDLDESASTVNENSAHKMPSCRGYNQGFDRLPQNPKVAKVQRSSAARIVRQHTAPSHTDHGSTWEPPDSDSDSDTYSVLFQKQMEVNRNYMRTLQQVEDTEEELTTV